MTQQKPTTVTWSIRYIDPSGFEAGMSVSGEESGEVMARAQGVMEYIGRIGGQPLPVGAGNGGQAAPPPAADIQPLGDGEQRMLIAKIKRTDATHADLFGRGHKYPDLKLFELADLLAVGISPDELPTGIEVPCRFFAVYTLSAKTNKQGNPYKDVVRLERGE